VHSFVIRFQKRENVDPNLSAPGILLKAHQDMEKLPARASCKAKEQSDVGKPAHRLQLHLPATRVRLEDLTLASDHPLYKEAMAEPPSEDEKKQQRAGAAVPLPSQRFPLPPDLPLYKGAVAEPPDASAAAAAWPPPRPLDQLPSPRFPLDPKVIAAYNITQEEYGLLAHEYLRRKSLDPEKAIDEVLDQINPDNASVRRETWPVIFVERGQDGNQVYLCDWQGLADKTEPRGDALDILLPHG
jgi:hypothetical protein